MKKYRSIVLVLSLGALVLAVTGTALSIEKLDRGAVMFPLESGGNYIGWRLLAEDQSDIEFDVYRKDEDGSLWLLKGAIVDSTNFIDESPQAGEPKYVVKSKSSSSSEVTSVSDVLVCESSAIGGMRRIKLKGDYAAQKVGFADFDGDGEYDFLIKQPDFNVDPHQAPNFWKPSPKPYTLELYGSDGKYRWSYDMGWSIETGVWYSPVVAFDIDGDGKAEVYTKAGEGDPRDERGQVTHGHEYLVKIDGETGEVVRKVDWPNRDRFFDRDGKGTLKYSYYSRNQLGIAFLDGQNPHLLVERGTYTNIKFDAYDQGMNRIWSWKAEGEHFDFQGQGAHGLQIADIDADGRDEIVYGSAALDDDGSPLWTTKRGHPDVCYVADIDPNRAGLEVFYGHEWNQKSGGLCLVDARTGETIWEYEGPTTHIHGQGMVADIDPLHPGMECYGGEKKGTGFWLYSASGERLADQSLGGLSLRAVFWRDGPTKSIIGKKREGYGYDWIGEVPGKVIAIADIVGDWREEFVVSDNGEIRIYSTVELASSRRTCLMQDRQYRSAVAMQTMGYFYPPMVGGK